MKYVLTIALLIATTAHAVGGNNGTTTVPAGSSANAVSSSVSGADSSSVSSADASGGTASAQGASSNVSVSQDAEAPAPAIGLVPAYGSMACIRAIGFGGSNQNGAVILGPSWRDRDCEAERTFTRLVELKLFIPASAAYCARPRHAAPFGSREQCEAQITQALIDAEMPAERVVYWPPNDEVCSESLRRCEATVGK